jgi:hypothetical protein
MRVPTQTLVVYDPMKPFMKQFVDCNSPTKSWILSDMQVEHQLLMPTRLESVSKVSRWRLEQSPNLTSKAIA